MTQPVHFFVNGKAVECAPDDADMNLIDYLHERQNLAGTKFGCGAGVCRACTVATRNKDGAPLEKTLACSTPVSFMQGMQVFTVESLGTEQQLAPLQQAFLEHFSFQCGYCTPGFLMAATTMLDHMKHNAVKESDLDQFILSWVGGNICRCTGYVRYLDAIRQVALPLTREGK